MAKDKDDQIALILGVIAKRARERGCQLTKIRLVKFLYLLDLFAAQASKATFTGWPWAFLHYGPYCRESTDAIDRAERLGFLAATAYESNYGDEDFRLYTNGERIGEPEIAAVQSALPFYVSGRLFADVARWCDDTYGLLNYVYFNTGPMRTARPGDRLSFEGEEKIDPRAFRPVAIAPLSDHKKKELRGIIERMTAERARAAAAASPLRLYDAAYDEFMTALNEDETPVGVAGRATLKVEPAGDD